MCCRSNRAASHSAAAEVASPGGGTGAGTCKGGGVAVAKAREGPSSNESLDDLDVVDALADADKVVLETEEK